MDRPIHAAQELLEQTFFLPKRTLFLPERAQWEPASHPKKGSQPDSVQKRQESPSQSQPLEPDPPKQESV
jgi:hypothetical protein